MFDTVFLFLRVAKSLIQVNTDRVGGIGLIERLLTFRQIHIQLVAVKENVYNIKEF